MEGWDLRALAVLERLNAAGHRAVLVGGCVRDRLMGRTPHDYDAATSARPEQIREACAPCGWWRPACGTGRSPFCPAACRWR